MKQTLRIMLVVAMVVSIVAVGASGSVVATHREGHQCTPSENHPCPPDGGNNGGDSAGDTNAEVDQKIEQDATAKSFQYQKVEQSNTNKGDVTQDERGPGSNNFIQSNYNEQSATNTASNTASQNATVSQG